MQEQELRAKCSLCSNYTNPPFARDGYCTFLMVSDDQGLCRYQGNLEAWHIKKGMTTFDAMMYRCRKIPRGDRTL